MPAAEDGPVFQPALTVDGTPWERTPTFSGLDENACRYTWNTSSGDFTFGPSVPYDNGNNCRQQGAIPEADAEIKLTSWVPITPAPEPTSLTLANEHTYPCTASTCLDATAPDSNFADSPELHLKHGDRNRTQSGLLRFDAVPAHERIARATIRVHIRFHGQELTLRLAATDAPDWSVTEATHNHCPSPAQEISSTVIRHSDNGDWAEFDITEYLTRHAPGPISVVIKTDQDSSDPAYLTSRHDPVHAPRLTVWTPGPCTSTITATLKRYRPPQEAEPIEAAFERHALRLLPLARAITPQDYTNALQQRLPNLRRIHTVPITATDQRIPCSADTYAWDRNPVNNYGNEERLLVKHTTSARFKRIAYLRFNTPDIWVTNFESIKQANIRVHAKVDPAPTGGPCTLKMYSVQDDWQEGSLTWEDRPTLNDEDVFTSTQVTTENTELRWIEFDVTEHLKKHLSDNPEKPLSVAIWKDTEHGNLMLYTDSRDHNNPARRPELDVRVSEIPHSRPDTLRVLVLPHEEIEVARSIVEDLRPLGARIRVESPGDYRIGITACIRLWPGADNSDGVITKSVKHRIKTYLDPLAGGDEGTGWPFGRSLTTADLYNLLETIPAIHAIDILTISDKSIYPEQKPSIIPLPADMLFHLEDEDITITIAPPSEAYSQPSPH